LVATINEVIMDLFITAIISGDRDFLIKRLYEHYKTNPKEDKIFKNISTEKLALHYSAQLLEEANYQPEQSPKFIVCFLRNPGELIKIIVYISEDEYFICYGVLDAIDYLKQNNIDAGINVKPILYYNFYQAVFAYELSIIESPYKK